VVLSGILIAKGAAVAAAWLPVLLPFLELAAVIGLAILVVEDLITMFQGGDSVIGRLLNKWFGPGSTQELIKWTKEVGEAFAMFFDDLSNNPAKFAENWKTTSDQIKDDIVNLLGPTFGNMVVTWIEMWGTVMGTFTEGWETFAHRWSAIGNGIVEAFKAAFDEIKFFGLGVIAELDDAATKLLKSLPGGLGDALAGSGTAAADIAKLRDKARSAHATELDWLALQVKGTFRDLSDPRYMRYGDGLIGPPVAANVGGVVVNVNGNATSETARRVGLAAEAGAMKGANRAAAALARKGKK
jgi:hypothetical protein